MWNQKTIASNKLSIETIANYQLFIPKDEMHDEKLHLLSSIAKKYILLEAIAYDIRLSLTRTQKMFF